MLLMRIFLTYDLKKLDNANLIVFGNLPYNISSQILTRFINYNTNDFKYKNLFLCFKKK